MILYKYRGNSQYTDQIFATGTVWLSTAQQLNDPFECSIQQLAGDWITRHTDEMKNAQMMGFVLQAAGALESGEVFFGQSRQEIKRTLKRVGREKGPSAIRYAKFCKAFRETTGDLPSDPDAVFRDLEPRLQAIGIFSLSSAPGHPLMWAHYADQHAGIAIGFEATPGSELADPAHCLPVAYRNDVPTFKDGFRVEMNVFLDSHGRPRIAQQISYDDEVFRAAISTKSPEWAYEQEWRYIADLGGSYAWPGPIVEIVFGLRCSTEQREHYRRLVAETVPDPVRFYEMAKVPNTNTLERLPVGDAP